MIDSCHGCHGLFMVVFFIFLTVYLIKLKIKRKKLKKLRLIVVAVLVSDIFVIDSPITLAVFQLIFRGSTVRPDITKPRPKT